jgi:hypothetical protein
MPINNDAMNGRSKLTGVHDSCGSYEKKMATPILAGRSHSIITDRSFFVMFPRSALKLQLPSKTYPDLYQHTDSIKAKSFHHCYP